MESPILIRLKVPKGQSGFFPAVESPAATAGFGGPVEEHFVDRHVPRAGSRWIDKEPAGSRGWRLAGFRRMHASGLPDLLQVGEIGVYEYVYEHGKNPGENTHPTYSYTYSYTRISSRSVV
jgi:hypothetical protein